MGQRALQSHSVPSQECVSLIAAHAHHHSRAPHTTDPEDARSPITSPLSPSSTLASPESPDANITTIADTPSDATSPITYNVHTSDGTSIDTSSPPVSLPPAPSVTRYWLACFACDDSDLRSIPEAPDRCLFHRVLADPSCRCVCCLHVPVGDYTALRVDYTALHVDYTALHVDYTALHVDCTALYIVTTQSCACALITSGGGFGVQSR